MANHLTVKQVVKTNEGETVVQFSNDRTMVVQTDGKREFLSANGRGLCCAPSSRHYPACVDMWNAFKRHAA